MEILGLSTLCVRRWIDVFNSFLVTLEVNWPVPNMAKPTHEGKCVGQKSWLGCVFESVQYYRLTGFVDIEQQMKAVQAERRKLNITESRNTVGLVCSISMVFKLEGRGVGFYGYEGHNFWVTYKYEHGCSARLIAATPTTGQTITTCLMVEWQGGSSNSYWLDGITNWSLQVC